MHYIILYIVNFLNILFDIKCIGFVAVKQAFPSARHEQEL